MDNERLRTAQAKGGRSWVLFAGQCPTEGYQVTAELCEGDDGTLVVACMVQPPEEGVAIVQLLASLWAPVRVDSHGRSIRHKPCRGRE